jgi:hypothetical protein
VRIPGALLAIALLAAACGGSAGRFEVTLDRNGGQATATIVDEIGLVTAVSAGAVDLPEPPPAQPFVWNPNGDLTRLALSWESDACSKRATLRLTGNALMLTIDEEVPASGCAAAHVTNLITMRIDRVVDTASVTVRMVAH